MTIPPMRLKDVLFPGHNQLLTYRFSWWSFTLIITLRVISTNGLAGGYDLEIDIFSQ